MSNPFSKPEKSTNPQLRNTFDLSFANNLTLDFGGLYPCFCKEVLPGDTFRIDTTFGLRFMPTAFPLQSRIRADVHFFYLRNRNLWNGWQEFITNSPEAAVQKPFPTLSVSNNASKMLDVAETCKLGDYLGLPTTLSGYFQNLHSLLSFNLPANGYDEYSSFVKFTKPVSDYLNGVSSSVPVGDRHPGANGRPDSDFVGADGQAVFRSLVGEDFFNLHRRVLDSADSNVVFFDLPLGDSPSIGAGLLNNMFTSGFYLQVKSNNQPDSPMLSSSYIFCCHLVNASTGIVVHTGVYRSRLDEGGNLYFQFPPLSEIPSYADGASCYDVRFTVQLWDDTLRNSPDWDYNSGLGLPFAAGSRAAFVRQPGGSTEGRAPYPVDLADLLRSGSGYSPWGSIPVSALPFRAYESIYNAFYRDERNNPYMQNGVPVYNRYIPSTDGGPDSARYEIRYRNWEQDFLTTALPSPQQGIAPLVGLTSTEATFMDPDTGKKYVAQPVFSDDGETLQTVKFTEDVPGSVARSLVQVASSGISINDFRNVNSLQRYLENNLRNGLKYIDNLRMRWGVNPSYAVMDMPEFIGGVSQAVSVSQVNQTAEGGDSSPLGSYAGQLSCIGSSKRPVSHHCDEHGFIIGILSVVPVPVYSSLLPKFFTKTEPLDYFTPEFSHIGLQPIPMREVAPVLVANYPATGDNISHELSQTFGYQRPWYDYLASVDEVHGLFRTNLKDFLLHRVFDGPPTLTPDFLTIDPDTLTDVFSVSVGGHKILGQMYFDVKAKRPIPRYCTPKLE